MIFVGYNFAGDEECLNPVKNNIGSLKRIKIQNGIFDEIKMDNEINSNYNENREEWGFYTRFLAKFNKNLLAGNVDFSGNKIAYLRIKRRKIEDLQEWITLKDIPYSNVLNTEAFDYLASADQEYEYALYPVTDSGIEGNSITSIIKSDFYSTFIVEKDKSFNLLYDLQYGDIERVSPSQKYEPYGSKYPVIIKNGQINYEQGDMSFTIISEDTKKLNGKKISKKSEVQFRKSILDFFTNGVPKLMKSHTGDTKLIMIVDNPKISFFNELNQQLAKLNINWVEIGDSENKNDLYNSNLIERVDV